MIQASITLSIVTIVTTFLLTVLGGFPLTDTAGGNPASASVANVDSDFDPSGVEQVSNSFLLCYTDIINDIVSHQKNPSLERAEARKEAFRDFAEALVGQYQDFSEEMQTRLDDAVAQSDAQVQQVQADSQSSE